MSGRKTSGRNGRARLTDAERECARDALLCYAFCLDAALHQKEAEILRRCADAAEQAARRVLRGQSLGPHAQTVVKLAERCATECERLGDPRLSNCAAAALATVRAVRALGGTPASA